MEHLVAEKSEKEIAIFSAIEPMAVKHILKNLKQLYEVCFLIIMELKYKPTKVTG